MQIGVSLGLSVSSTSALSRILAIYASGAKGLMMPDFGDFSKLFQNSAGTTPVTAVDDFVGRALDISGNGLNLFRATSSARPQLKYDDGVYNLTCDGIDDGLGIAASAGVFAAASAAFALVKTDGLIGETICFSYAGEYFGSFGGGNSSAAASNLCGSNSYYAVNGVVVPGGGTTTRAQLAAAIPVGQWCVVEARNLNMSAWASLTFGYFSALYPKPPKLGASPIVISETTEDNATLIRRYLAQKAGITL